MTTLSGLAVFVVLVGCERASPDPPAHIATATRITAAAIQTPPAASPAKTKTPGELAARLRGDKHFLIGLGNDLAADHDKDGAYTLGPKLDLHYAYLVGLQGQGGWPDWNPNGSFVDALVQSANAHGTTPMFTLYAMAAWGENNMSVLTDDKYMRPYWAGVKLLFTHLGSYKQPSVVHFEPDFWGFAQRASPKGTRAVKVSQLASECSGLPDDLTGMSRCLVRIARTYSPQTAIGFHASEWAGSPESIVAFMKTIGADAADFIVTDALDRDAGCIEAGVDPSCKRAAEGWYLDETNRTSPNFHERLAWAKRIADGVGLPMMWWQVPLGVPSSSPGGTPGHYRDNHVRYFFDHVGELVAAGGVGAVFGTGAERQTTIQTDGGQFKTAVTKYFAQPMSLP